MRLLLIVSVFALFVLGLIMIFSTTSAEVLDLDLKQSTHYALSRQIFYAGFGCFVGWFIWRMGYRWVLNLSPLLMLGLTFLLGVVFVPGIGKVVNGAHRWIGVGGFSMQPSEFAKIVIPVWIIYQLRGVDVCTLGFWEFVRKTAWVGLPILMILVEPDNATVGVIGIVLLVLVILAKVPAKYWGIPLVVGVMVAGISAYQLPYVTARLQVYLNPELDLQGKGHQPHQAKIAAGSGQLLGKGPGNSWQKLSYLPEAQNDYIAAIYAEEFGFIGVMGLVMLYMSMAYFGFHIAHQASTLEGCHLAASMTFLVVFQAFLNLGVVSGLLPTTGLNLPFFSQGGSSLIANVICIGLILSVGEPSTSQRSLRFKGDKR